MSEDKLIPDGWVLMPREPTAAMKAAVRDAGGMRAAAYAWAAWPTMIAAAPPAPVSTADVVERAKEWLNARTSLLNLETPDVRKSPDAELAWRRLGTAEAELAAAIRKLGEPDHE